MPNVPTRTMVIINDLSPFLGGANIESICAKTQSITSIRAKYIQNQGICVNDVSTYYLYNLLIVNNIIAIAVICHNWHDWHKQYYTIYLTLLTCQEALILTGTITAGILERKKNIFDQN